MSTSLEVVGKELREEEFAAAFSKPLAIWSWRKPHIQDLCKHQEEAVTEHLSATLHPRELPDLLDGVTQQLDVAPDFCSIRRDAVVAGKCLLEVCIHFVHCKVEVMKAFYEKGKRRLGICDSLVDREEVL